MRAHIFDGRRIVVVPLQVRPLGRVISPAFDARNLEYLLRAFPEACSDNADVLIGRRAPDHDLPIRLRHCATFCQVERVTLARYLVAIDLVAKKQSAIVAA